MITIVALFLAGVCLLDAHHQRQSRRDADRRLRRLIKAQPPKQRGRQPGEPINMRYASDRAFARLIRDIQALEPLHLVDGDGDAA